MDLGAVSTATTFPWKVQAPTTAIDLKERLSLSTVGPMGPDGAQTSLWD